MDVDEVTLRSALGVDVSKWDTAGVLAFSLRQIDMLQYMNDGNKARACKWIVQQFYHILFQKFGKSLVDNKRRCAWYFNSDVRLGFLSSDAFVTSTEIMTGSGPRPSDSGQFRHDPLGTQKPLHLLLRHQLCVSQTQVHREIGY